MAATVEGREPGYSVPFEGTKPIEVYSFTCYLIQGERVERVLPL
jgi:hypothetical protein